MDSLSNYPRLRLGIFFVSICYTFVRLNFNDFRTAFVSTLVLSTAVLATALVSSKVVGDQFRKQCANRDWPEAADRVHFDYCVASGHAVGKRPLEWGDVDTDVPPNVSFSEVDAYTVYDAEKAKRSAMRLW